MARWLDGLNGFTGHNGVDHSFLDGLYGGEVQRVDMFDVQLLFCQDMWGELLHRAFVGG